MLGRILDRLFQLALFGSFIYYAVAIGTGIATQKPSHFAPELVNRGVMGLIGGSGGIDNESSPPSDSPSVIPSVTPLDTPSVTPSPNSTLGESLTPTP